MTVAYTVGWDGGFGGGWGMFILVIFVEYVENSPKRCEKPITHCGGRF